MTRIPTPTILLLALIVIVCVISYVSDNMGKSLGKKRLSILGLRPRQTATMLSMLSSVLIMLVTLGALTLFSGRVQDALVRSENLRRQVEQQKYQLSEVQRQRSEVQRLSQEELRKSQQQTQTLRQKTTSLQQQAATIRGNAVRDIRKANERIGDARSKASEAESKLGTARIALTSAQQAQVEAQQGASAAKARASQAQANFAAAQSRLSAAKSRLGAAQSRFSAVQSRLSTVNFRLSTANTRLQKANKKTQKANQSAIIAGRETVKASREVARLAAEQEKLQAKNESAQANLRNAQTNLREVSAAFDEASAAFDEISNRNLQIERASALLDVGEVAVRWGQTFADVTVPAGSDARQARALLRQLLDKGARAASEVGAQPYLNPATGITRALHLASLPLPSSSGTAELDEEAIITNFANRLATFEVPVSVRLVAGRSYAKGETQMEGRLVEVPVRKVYVQGDTIALVTLPPNEKDFQIFSDLLKLADKGAELARGKGVQPLLSAQNPNLFADDTNERIFEAIRRIQQQAGAVAVRLVAARDVSTVDTIRVRFDISAIS